MARPNSETPVVETSPEAPKPEVLTPLTTESLLQVILAMQKQQQDANAALVEAILDSKKPYVDPRKAENDKLFDDQAKDIELRRKVNIRAAQDTCEHIAGSSNLSEQKDLYGRTSIVWHKGDVGQIFGLCTTCGRHWHQDDPDFATWRAKRSFNKQSGAGERYVPDPVKAQKASRL